MIIETKRLTLRPFTVADALDVFEYLNEPTVHCFADMKVDTLADAVNAVVERAEDDELYLAIVLKETDTVIGEISAIPEASASDEKSTWRDTFSPCWILHPDYHGNGYAYEAAYAFLDYLFNEKGARRIYAYTEDDNVASQKLCEKLGMRREGLFREFVSFVKDEEGNPIYENTYQYAILKKEWKSELR